MLVCSIKQALEYRARIMAALPAGSTFEPLMTLYLTDKTSPDEVGARAACPLFLIPPFFSLLSQITRAKETKQIFAVKV